MLKYVFGHVLRLPVRVEGKFVCGYCPFLDQPTTELHAHHVSALISTVRYHGLCFVFLLTHHLLLASACPTTLPSTLRSSKLFVRLRLANSSSEFLTLSQLHAMRGELFKTLAIVDDQIHTIESGTYIR